MEIYIGPGTREGSLVEAFAATVLQEIREDSRGIRNVVTYVE